MTSETPIQILVAPMGTSQAFNQSNIFGTHIQAADFISLHHGLGCTPSPWIDFSAGMQKASQRHAKANNWMGCSFNLLAAR